MLHLLMHDNTVCTGIVATTRLMQPEGHAAPLPVLLSSGVLLLSVHSSVDAHIRLS